MATSHRVSLFVRSCALVAVCAVTVLSPADAEAQSASYTGGEFGLGLIIGDPTGISGKYFLSREVAIDGAFGFSFFGHDHLQLHMDFLWHFGIQRWSAVSLDLYVGVGPMLGFHDHDHGPRGPNGRHDHESFGLGARAPFGAALTFNKAPIDIFLEIALGLWLIEDVDLDLDAAIGVRYWF